MTATLIKGEPLSSQVSGCLPRMTAWKQSRNCDKGHASFQHFPWRYRQKYVSRGGLARGITNPGWYLKSISHIESGALSAWTEQSHLWQPPTSCPGSVRRQINSTIACSANVRRCLEQDSAQCVRVAVKRASSIEPRRERFHPSICPHSP